MYILSGLWSLHRFGQCSFVYFSGNLAFHRFSHTYVVLELFFYWFIYLVVHYSIVGITIGLWAVCGHLAGFCGLSISEGGFVQMLYIFMVICDCFGHSVVILRLLVYHFVRVY